MPHTLKQRSRYRPFADAQSFVRPLKLNTQKEWNKYCKEELKGYPQKPKDIPASPQRVYKDKGWDGVPDWLGNGKTTWQRNRHRSFTDAQSFVRSLKLNTQKEWLCYCKGKLKGYPSKPKDIPASPQRVYKGKGWDGMRDWLGTKKITYRPFEEARSFARSLKLSSYEEWSKYCKGKLKGYPPKPKDIPASPQRVYKDKEWGGVSDWLGNGKTIWQRNGHRSFTDTRSFVRSLQRSSYEEWVKYCKGELKGYPPKPKDIPGNPRRTYNGKGWDGMRDWLGTKKITYRPFTDAQSFVRSLKLSTHKEWVKYYKGGLEGYPPKPKDIPANPRRTYNGKGWKNTPDWLGNDYRPSEYRSFADAQSFVRSLQLSSCEEWVKYCKGELKGYPPKPKDIPASPQRTYNGKGWDGMRDWLGTKKITYRPFTDAQSFVRSLKLSIS